MGREVRRVSLDLEWPPRNPPDADGFFHAPEGPGFQLWNTTPTPGGLPMSPVFKEPEQLAQWLADTKAKAFADETAHKDAWLNMILGDGRAVTAVADKHGTLKSGVSHMYEEAKARESREFREWKQQTELSKDPSKDQKRNR